MSKDEAAACELLSSHVLRLTALTQDPQAVKFLSDASADLAHRARELRAETKAAIQAEIDAAKARLNS